MAHLHKGICFKQINSFESAMYNYRKAIEIRSNIPNFNNIAKYNMGCLQLLMGDYKEGWKNYEYRKKEELKLIVNQIFLI